MMIMMIIMVMVMIPMAKMRIIFPNPFRPRKAKVSFCWDIPVFVKQLLEIWLPVLNSSQKKYIYIYFQSILIFFHSIFNRSHSISSWGTSTPGSTPQVPHSGKFASPALLGNLQIHQGNRSSGTSNTNCTNLQHASALVWNMVLKLYKCRRAVKEPNPLSISRFICRQHRQLQNTQQNDWTEKLTTSATLSKSSAKCNHHKTKFVAETPCPPPSIQYCFLAMHCFISNNTATKIDWSELFWRSLFWYDTFQHWFQR